MAALGAPWASASTSAWAARAARYARRHLFRSCSASVQPSGSPPHQARSAIKSGRATWARRSGAWNRSRMVHAPTGVQSTPWVGRTLEYPEPKCTWAAVPPRTVQTGLTVVRAPKSDQVLHIRDVGSGSWYTNHASWGMPLA
eukprot:jgi/Mesvir1/17848/Mv25368-RA.1